MEVAQKFIVCCHGITNRLNSKLLLSPHSMIPGLALISQWRPHKAHCSRHLLPLVSVGFTCECPAWVLFPQGISVRRKTSGLSMQEEIQFPVQKYSGTSRLLPTNTQDFFLPRCFTTISFHLDNGQLRAWHKNEQ